MTLFYDCCDHCDHEFDGLVVHDYPCDDPDCLGSEPLNATEVTE